MLFVFPYTFPTPSEALNTHLFVRKNMLHNIEKRKNIILGIQFIFIIFAPIFCFLRNQQGNNYAKHYFKWCPR